MDKNKPELLAPVGGFLQLIAAVENGADAVYMGGLNYNARMYADNFNTLKEIEEAVDYAHLRNVKVYVTLNTLVNDEEMIEVVKYAKKLYELGVDAVIVQDLGLVDVLSKEVSNLKVHISTQATIYSKDGVNYFNKYQNVERVVLARELSLVEIEDIVKNVDSEIEIFIHGALCVCYSGQCKLSSQIGARSGNRGKCAQPCRLPYKIEKINESENYYLSTKDVCLIDILPKVIETGVKSLKIEGRMKSPEYVAAVTRIYRKYIDAWYNNENYEVSKEDKEILLQVFNRGGFSTGYLESSDSKNIWCDTIPKNSGRYLGEVIEYNSKRKNIKIKLEADVANGDVIEIVNKQFTSFMLSYICIENEVVKKADNHSIVILGDVKGNIQKGDKVYKIISKRLNDDLKQSFNKKCIKKTSVDSKIELRIGKVPKLNLKCEILGKKFDVTVTEKEKCELAKNRSLQKEDIKQNLSKTGDVPFVINNIDYVLDDNLFIKVANLNNLRKKAFEKLSEKVVREFKKQDVCYTKERENSGILISQRKVQTKISGYIYRLDLLEDISVLTQFDRIYISLEDYIKYSQKIAKLGITSKVFIYFPTVTNLKYRKYIYGNIDMVESIKNILITNVEHFDMLKGRKLNIALDNSFNVFNSVSLEVLGDSGVQSVNLSNELSLIQIENMKVNDGVNVEIDVYGNLQAMYSNFCMLKANGKCGLCKKIQYNLIDRKGKKFPCLFNSICCSMQILNTDKLFSKEAVDKLYGKVEYMRMYIYNEKNEEIINCINNIKGKGEKEIISNENTKYTNGHFFREV